jgi:hypothetical protein
MFHKVSGTPNLSDWKFLNECSLKKLGVFFKIHIIWVGLQDVPGGYVSILGSHSISHSKQKVYMYMCPIPNGFRDRDIPLYTSKIVDIKEILRTVSNTGIYCSSDKVGTVYLV